MILYCIKIKVMCHVKKKTMLTNVKPQTERKYSNHVYDRICVCDLCQNYMENPQNLMRR